VVVLAGPFELYDRKGAAAEARRLREWLAERGIDR
jgi:hypothetical protein